MQKLLVLALAGVRVSGLPIIKGLLVDCEANSWSEVAKLK